MQRNETLRNVLIAGAVFAIIMAIAPKLMPPPLAPPATAPPEARTSGTGLPGETPPTTASSSPSSTTSGVSEGASTASGGLSAVEAEREEIIVVGADEVRAPGKKAGWAQPYRMRLAVSNVGASVASAWMTDHAAHVGDGERYEFLSPVDVNGTTFRSLAVEKINLDGADLVLFDKRWTLARHENYEQNGESGQLVEFAIDVLRAGAPVARVRRVLKLPQQAYGTNRHDLYSEITVENIGDQSRQVILTYRGGTGIPRNDARMDDRFVDAGIRTSGQAVNGVRRSAGEIYKTAGAPLPLYTPSLVLPGERFSWAAMANTYFTCTVAPLNRTRDGEADYIVNVSAFDADASPLTDRDVSVRFVTRPEPLPSGGRLRYPADIYLGEKSADGFKSVESYRQRNYYFQVSQGYGYCTFAPLVTLMIWLLDRIYSVIPDYGLAIMVLVLLVRTLLHPITKKGQVNMVRMQHQMAELQPKIEEIKKKYANDKVRMNQEMMKLNINPAGQLLTCLPMLIQMPIWVALYLSLSHNINMRHEPFLFTWVRDLTAQDALYTFASPIVVPLAGWHLPSFNLLPILVALTMYIQQKLMPKPKPNPNLSEEQRMQQEMMQKMMPMMSIMMLFIFYKMPSGLNLYIMSSSIFGSIEQWRIRKHIKEKEEAGTLHKMPKPAPPANGQPKRRSGGSFFERLQEMAEEARKMQKAKSKK